MFTTERKKELWLINIPIEKDEVAVYFPLSKMKQLKFKSSPLVSYSQLNKFSYNSCGLYQIALPKVDF